MARSNGMRLLDGIVVTTVLVAFTWFKQQAPPSAPVIAAILVAAAGLAIWVPDHNDAPSAPRLPRIVLFAAGILGFIAGGLALQMAGEASTGGFVLAVLGIACLTVAAAMLRMLGWRSQHAERSEAARA